MEMVDIPVSLLERLYQSYYFEAACRYYNIENWERYQDVLLRQTQLATSDILKDNKEVK